MWLYVPSASAPDTAGSISECASLSPEPVLWPTLSGTPSARPCSWRGWKTRPWIARLSGTISRPSTAELGVVRWISSLRDSRVSPCPSPASEPRKRTAVGSGLTSLGSFATWDRDSSSWRTCADLFSRGSETYSRRWPSSGSMRNGACSVRAPSELHTHGPECSSLPTPDASVRTGSNRGGANGRVGKERPTLAELAKRAGGRPNPLLWEWVMGLPEGWTDFAPLATGSFRRWQRQHSAPSPLEQESA